MAIFDFYLKFIIIIKNVKKQQVKAEKFNANSDNYNYNYNHNDNYNKIEEEYNNDNVIVERNDSGSITFSVNIRTSDNG